MRNMELPGRNTVHAANGMAATSHTVSTLAAVNVLQLGGNAMDAAIAAVAVQCVVEPESTGIGGDCFCLYSPEGSDDLIAFNGSGKAPAGATADYFADQGITEIERHSPHSVTVPSAVDAWDRLIRDHGTMDLGDLLQPAIALARDGYAVAPRVASDWAGAADKLAIDSDAAARFLPGGRAPRAGEKHRQPELAETLSKIAEHGRDAFYSGAVAEDMVEKLQSLGGVHTLDDFAAVEGNYVEPIKTDFRGYEVWECPPNGQGVFALLLLNIMSGFETAGVDPLSAERLHLEIEAGRLAYQDRNAFLADPSQAEVPVEWLLSQAHADELRAHIDPERAMADLPPVTFPNHESTVYISVVDKDRNAVSFINTLFNTFGSTRLAPRSGVMLHSRGQGFVLDPAHPNCIAPGKRPLHTIIPGMLVKGGRAVMPFGVMGGQYQAFGHMHLLTKFIDFGFDIQEAMDLPRLFPIPGTREVEAESGIPAETIERLKAMGHNLVEPSKPIGGSQAVWIDWDNGTLTGGSEPRKDGCALGY